MIWGAREEKYKMDLLFPRECLLRIIFSWGRPLEIYFFLKKAFWNLFFLGVASNFFSLYKPIKKLPSSQVSTAKHVSYPQLTAIFVLWKAFWYLFFLGTAFRNLFFPGDGPTRFFFSISFGPPPRSLMVVPLVHERIYFLVPLCGTYPDGYFLKDYSP